MEGFVSLLKYWSTVWEEEPGAVTCSPEEDVEIPLVKDGVERAGVWETVSLCESKPKEAVAEVGRGVSRCV